MIYDVLFSYDGKKYKVESSIANFHETRVSKVGISKEKLTGHEQLEFFGEHYTAEDC